MIKKFIDKLLGKGPGAAASPRCRWASASRSARPSTASTRACSTSARCAWCARCKEAGHEAYIVGGAVRDLLVGPAAEGLRRRHQRHARAGQGAVPPRLHHRPALSHRARRLRPRPRARGDRGLDLPRAARRRGGRAGQRQREDLEAASSPARRTSSTPAAACCATTSGARRSKTRRGATSPSTRCTTTRPSRSWSTTTAASRTRRSACCA